MLTTLRVLRLLPFVLWLGSLLFFAAVLAPVAFSPEVIERTHGLAVPGLIVGTALGRLHLIGLSCGVVLLVVTVLLRLAGGMGPRLAAFEVALVAGMLLLTAYSQCGIVPRMEVDRRAVGEIDAAPHGNPYRDDFDRLHGLSVRVESGVILAGIGLLVLIAAEGGWQATSPTPVSSSNSTIEC